MQCQQQRVENPFLYLGLWVGTEKGKEERALSPYRQNDAAKFKVTSSSVQTDRSTDVKRSVTTPGLTDACCCLSPFHCNGNCEMRVSVAKKGNEPAKCSCDLA